MLPALQKASREGSQLDLVVKARLQSLPSVVALQTYNEPIIVISTARSLIRRFIAKAAKRRRMTSSPKLRGPSELQRIYDFRTPSQILNRHFLPRTDR